MVNIEQLNLEEKNIFVDVDSKDVFDIDIEDKINAEEQKLEENINYSSGQIKLDENYEKKLKKELEGNIFLSDFDIVAKASSDVISDEKLKEVFFEAFSEQDLQKLDKKTVFFKKINNEKIKKIVEKSQNDWEILKNILEDSSLDNNLKLVIFRAYYIFNLVKSKVGYNFNTNNFDIELKLNQENPGVGVSLKYTKIEQF